MTKPTFNDYIDTALWRVIQIGSIGTLVCLGAAVIALMLDHLGAASLAVDWAVSLWMVTIPLGVLLGIARLTGKLYE